MIMETCCQLVTLSAELNNEPLTNSISDCFLIVYEENLAQMPNELLVTNLHGFLFFFVIFNHVDGLLHIAEDKIAMTVISLYISAISVEPQGSLSDHEDLRVTVL